MKTVSVLLSTYNGAKYLREQIDSLLKQEGVNVKIFVRDDGSKDDTVKILEEYESRGEITLEKGKNVGFSQSFSWLINNAPQADYYACCDQDDVWLPTKILDGVNALENENNHEQPLVYFTSLNVVDENLNLITKDSHIHYNNNSPTLFIDNVLMPQCNGCTFVFNQKLKDLYSTIPSHNIFTHDYTLMTLTSAFGKVIFSNNSKILYRQHASNAYGFYKGSLRNMLRSVKAFFKNEIKCIKSHEAMLFRYYFFDKLKPQDKIFVDLITSYRFNKPKRKQLKKFIKQNIKNKTIRRFTLVLLKIKRL